MNRLFFVAALALATSLTQAQTITVDSELRPNIDFSHYKSYVWASQVENKLDPKNSVILKKQVQDAVGYALDGRGYTFIPQSPDLLVNFQVFDQPTTIKGYVGADAGYVTPGEGPGLNSDKDISVNAGTILVNLIDTKTDQVVWQGLASGLTSSDGFDRQKGKVREAVNLIFNKYPYRADKF
jgi:hypothetical protein